MKSKTENLSETSPVKHMVTDLFTYRGYELRTQIHVSSSINDFQQVLNTFERKKRKWCLTNEK